ncbi:MAG: lysine--tRNA ligase [Gammaproteobacteria bacterium]|nr:lysine--tRNA ligase [Gammaproteobacteria bacterium]
MTEHTHDHKDDNKLIAQRREKLNAIREKRNAFPNGFRRTAYGAELDKQFADKDKEQLEKLGHVARVAGRVIRMRGPFVVIQDSTAQVQLYMNNKTLPEELVAELKLLDLGDIIGAEGTIFRTGKGELTVRATDFSLLTKALRPLPDKYKGLTDTEVRYRQRYVDLIVNEESRQVFATRSRIVNFLRDYFNQLGFMEVETPMMHVIPGGATARPFITHHNALDQEMYLRIAPELFLKRLVVGGFERVFEINRSFRNEGLSTRHNPEFTMLEFYQSYTDYQDLMNLTEDLFRRIAVEVIGSPAITYQGTEYDFSNPFVRLTVNEAVLKYCDDIEEEALSSREQVARIAEGYGIVVDESMGTGKIIMEIFEEKVEHKLDQPTFITAYPTEVSPLARRNETNPDIADRFELIIGGRELANGFSELNDAEDQAARFEAQVARKEAGDNEAMHFDEDYITALEYGMPPTAGEGIGVDRLVMLFTDSASIKDVLLFPHMRPHLDR